LKNRLYTVFKGISLVDLKRNELSSFCIYISVINFQILEQFTFKHSITYKKCINEKVFSKLRGLKARTEEDIYESLA